MRKRYETLKLRTWYDTDIMRLIAQRVYLTTFEYCIGLQIKDDKIKIIGTRQPPKQGFYLLSKLDIREAYKNKKVFQKIIDKDKFIKDIKDYIDYILKHINFYQGG